MGEWIWVAEALKIHHITKPTLYKYIGLWKVFTKVEKNRLFIDRLWLKEYINKPTKDINNQIKSHIILLNLVIVLFFFSSNKSLDCINHCKSSIIFHNHHTVTVASLFWELFSSSTICFSGSLSGSSSLWSNNHFM